MALIAYLFYRERVSVLKMLGIALCFGGVALVVGGGDPQRAGAGGSGWLGEALIGGCVLSWSAYSVFCKSVVRQLGPLHTVTYSIYAGTLMLAVYTACTGRAGFCRRGAVQQRRNAQPALSGHSWLRRGLYLVL